MFQSEDLKEHLETKHTIRANPRVYAEINLNDPTNVDTIGVYRYRPNGSDATYRSLPVVWDPQDSGDHYVNAEMSYAEVGGTYEGDAIDNASEVVFREEDKYFASIYSLEDCFRQHRPRSGINKLLYLGSSGTQRKTPQFISGGKGDPSMKPRFYASSRNDHFKYWTSYKRQGSDEYGISYEKNGVYPIDDAVPFIVYRDPIPANRIVVKVQTLIGAEQSEQIIHNGELIDDPFSGVPKVPSSWSIQALVNGSWGTIYTFNGTEDIPWHGHIEIGYGILVPRGFEQTFFYAGTLTHETFLPETAGVGAVYLIMKNQTDHGVCWIKTEEGWESFEPRYGWMPEPEGVTGQSHFVSKIVDPYMNGFDSYREFMMIQGLRLVVDTMRTPDSTFDLIELSPRLAMEWTDRAEAFSVNKAMADLGNSALPVGKLMASTGSISLNNNDSALNTNNVFDRVTGRGSIIAGHMKSRIKFSFVENIIGVNGYDYFIPIKTLYAETNPSVNDKFTDIEITLRDLYYLFETMAAPSLFMTEVSLSRAVMSIMDHIGFSNYTFKRLPGQVDPVIPYFFIPPDRTVAEVMMELAAATQSAMYLDETNNLVVATKEYILPEAGKRPTDMVMRGNDKDGKLANIRAISSAERPVYNSGEITYTKRYIQRTYGSLNQAMYQPQDKTWIYAPSMVWEVSGDEKTKALNENAGAQSTFTLTAMPLRTSLSSTVPSVSAGKIINNTMDVGESANFVARYDGYLYANGEIIRYDAVEYSVTGTGNVWITSADEYQNYMLSLPFRGKMYPTGLIRIYSRPFFDNGVPRPGAVERHGRGQFGTKITSHMAGLSSEWTSPDSVRGVFQNAEPLFNMRESDEYQKNLRHDIPAGMSRGGINSTVLARGSSRSSIIKNNLSQKFWSEAEINNMYAAKTGTLQSSALVFTGPTFPAEANPRDHVSYIYKSLDSYYSNFGTRCRIIGRIESGEDKAQTPIGATTYFRVPSDNPSEQSHISGGSGGIGVNVNPNTNSGYFFEIAALTSADPSSYSVPDTETETLIGKVTEVIVYENVATVRVDQSETRVIPTLNIGDHIGISGVSEQDFPTIDGVYTLESMSDQGMTLSMTIPSIPYTWGSFGVIKSGGVDMGIVQRASVDSGGIASVTFATPMSLVVGNTIQVEGFDTPSSVPNINNSGMVILTVSPDSKTVTFAVPKINHTYATDAVKNAVVRRVKTEAAKVSNIWFYKTVADDMGGKMLSWYRDQNRTTIHLDSHRFSAGDLISVRAGQPVDGDYQVAGVVGNTVHLNRGGSSGNVATVPQQGNNNVGLTTPVATTYKLWSGLTNVLVDPGSFVGQYRSLAEENTTVYDLAVESSERTNGRVFYLFINNRQVATVMDTDPLLRRSGMALFVRGQSKLMFENVYAMGENLNSRGISEQVDSSHISEVFGIPDGISESEALRKYAVSGFVQSGYLSGISGSKPPHYNMYYDEFGTIMREAVYFNIKYDDAYPALYARLAPVINRIKGYTVSGFMAGAYGAEFMIFNNLDTLCALDPSTGNYLRIHGVVFTKETTKTLTVDNYLQNLSLPVDDRSVLRDPGIATESLNKIKASRMRYGRNDFSVASDYIQDDGTAEKMMEWVLSKVAKPRLNVGADIFQMPIVQLGDLVTFDYRDNKDRHVLSNPDSQFVVYNMTYSKSEGSAEMVIYTTEVS